jgi:hypothetical protein
LRTSSGFVHAVAHATLAPLTTTGRPTRRHALAGGAAAEAGAPADEIIVDDRATEEWERGGRNIRANGVSSSARPG